MDTGILGALLRNETSYLADNPYYVGGANYLQSPNVAPQNNSQAFLLPILKGLGGGLLTGYGKEQADQQYLGDTQTTLGKVLGQPDYQFPEGTTAQAVPLALAQALLDKELRDKKELQQIDATSSLAQMLAGKGAMVDPKTGQLAAIPNLAQIEASKELAIEQAKQEAKADDLSHNKLTQQTVSQINDKIKAVAQINGALDRVDTFGGSDNALGGIWNYAAGAINPNSEVSKYQRNLPALADELAKGYAGTARAYTTKQIQEALSAGFAESAGSIKDVLNTHKNNLLNDAFGQLSKLDTAGYAAEGLQAQLEGARNGELKAGVFDQPKVDSAIPPGMKRQRNPTTGETRLVPQ